jgi:hypothetical protein
MLPFFLTHSSFGSQTLSYPSQPTVTISVSETVPHLSLVGAEGETETIHPGERGTVWEETGAKEHRLMMGI